MPEPLRKRRPEPDGTPYFRPARVEAKLVALERLPREELAKRCGVLDEKHPDHVPTECLLHFVRATRGDNSKTWQERLFRRLFDRVRRRLPKKPRGGTETLASEGIRRFVLDRFEELLAIDQAGYCESLDFYEVAFEAALSKLRTDAERKVGREQRRLVRVADEDPDWATVTPEASVAPFVAEGIDDPAYLSRVDAAIASLPRELREVVELLRLGFPIDGKDPGETTIAGSLGVVEKTVRNRRDRAYAAIRARMAEDEP